MPKAKNEKGISLEDLSREELLILLKRRWFRVEQHHLWEARWRCASDKGMRLQYESLMEMKAATARGDRADWLKANAKGNMSEEAMLLIRGKDLGRVANWMAPVYRLKFWGAFIHRRWAFGLLVFHPIQKKERKVADVFFEVGPEERESAIVELLNKAVHAWRVASDACPDRSEEEIDGRTCNRKDNESTWCDPSYCPRVNF